MALSDLKAISLIRNSASVQEANEMLRLDPGTIDKAIAQLLKKCISVRQLSRLAGIPRGHVESVSRRKVSE